jgi:thiol-disulfide isomerase/thioredoxin
MDRLFNQYSFVLISAGVLIAVVIILWRLSVSRRVISATVGLLLVFVLVSYFLLRPGLSDVGSTSAAESIIQNGKPTFLEFFSNYCAGCLAIRPVVDEIAVELGDEFNILRIDIHTDAGRELRERYAFNYTPEFILFNQQGEEVWRGHNPPNDNQLSLVQTVGS